MLSRNPWQAHPQPHNRPKQANGKRLQHLDTLCLRNGSNSKRQHRATARSKGRRKANRGDVQPTRQQLGRHDHDGREQRPEEEPLQRDGHGRNVEVRNEPEDEAQGDGGDEIDLQPLACMKYQEIGKGKTQPKWLISHPAWESQTPGLPGPL